MDVTAEYKAIFAEEAAEHLAGWEEALLALERSPADMELVNQMFRAIHTLKGSAGFIGFEELQRTTHELESRLQEVREGARDLSPAMLELLFQGLDLARRMVDRFTAGRPFEEGIEAFIAALQDMDAGAAQGAPRRKAPGRKKAGAGREPAQPPRPAEPPAPPANGNLRRFVCDLLIHGPGREAYLRAFLLRNRLSGVATIVREEPTPESLRDSGEKFAYRMTLDTFGDEKALREAMNVDQLEIRSLKEPASATEERGETGNGTAGQAERPGGAVSAARIEEVVRVSVDRLDTLLNLVGELVIQNSGFQAIAQSLRAIHGRNALIVELEEKTEALTKITRDLQDGIMKVRMLPVNNVFARFHRVVRDLAKDRRKEIHLEVYGEATEIDKKVMDRIGDPLVHLVRNAVDHGIEPREARIAAGKSPVGLIRLGAYQDGDHICIEISDDGRGLDRQLILATAVERGLVNREEAARLTDEQVLSMIFLPGFSTAKVVSEISGRGVGMDVVKRAIEAMGGSLRIRSATGRGTTITVSLPLTMAIIPAVLVEVKESVLAIPLSSVKEVLKVHEEELSTIGRRPVIRLREEVLSMVSLSEALGLEEPGEAQGGGMTDETAPESETPTAAAEPADRKIDERRSVIVVDYEERRVGLGVDRVIGTGEIVIKSLSRHYREIDGLIGASILGNGKIALIVDVESMVRRYHQDDKAHKSYSEGAIFGIQIEPGLEHAAGPAPGAAVNRPAAPEEPAAGEADPIGEPAAEVPAPEEPEVGDPGGEEPDGEVPDGEESQPADEIEELALELAAPPGAMLEEIHNSGAVIASMAVSQLTGEEIRVSFPESQFVNLSEVADTLGGEEEPAGGIYVSLGDGLEGGVLMMVPLPNLLRLHDLLHHQPAGTCREPAEVDLSAISELGNILSASFINAISDATRIEIRNEPPEISVDMCASVIDSVLARFNQPGEKILLTRALIYVGQSEQVVCHLLLFLEPTSLKSLLDALSGDGH